MAEYSPIPENPDISRNVVDADSPWLGLLPFTEATQRYFFGRDSEIRELFLRVQGNPLTVIYGQSGYGKTSLLNAGLLPKLRADLYRPVRLRLRYGEADPPLPVQLRTSLALIAAKDEDAAPQLRASWGDASPWECFHRSGLLARDLNATPPVLVFDQFEEIFTLGAAQRPHEEIETFAAELADLIENRPPSLIKKRLGEDPEFATELDFGSSPLRVVITLREDFLSHLEAWKGTLPSLMRNRMALHLLRGPQAWEAVFKPGNREGRELVSSETAKHIVTFVADKDGLPLEEIEAVPPLLSLVCSELNKERIMLKAKQILPYQLQGKVEEILSSFYDGCFAGLPLQVKELVESRLLSPDGFRESISLDTAIDLLVKSKLSRGEAEDSLRSLEDKRLVICEDRSGTRRVELTHDVLTRVAVRSRDLGKELKPTEEEAATLGKTTEVRPVRIFISCPGDVANERERAKSVIESLRRRYARNFDLRAILWEDMPLHSDGSFQEQVDEVLSVGGIDIALFILWSRLGSPFGPQIRRADGSEYRSGTERELDLLLQAREQSKGQRPQILIYTRKDETGFEQRLRGADTSAKQEMIEQKELVENFIRREFHDVGSGTNLRAYHAYDQPATFAQRFRVHLQEILDGMAGDTLRNAVWDIGTQGIPFRGLEAYHAEHSAIFCGREDESRQVREMLDAQSKAGCAFLLVTGTSGSGKTSFVSAGVVPDLVTPGDEGEDLVWSTAFMRPSDESVPIRALARAIISTDPSQQQDLRKMEELAARLARSPEELSRADSVLGHSGRQRLLIVVDQLEELFIGGRFARSDCDAFFTVLETLAESGWVWLLATVRSDFRAQCVSSPQLVRMMNGPSGVFDLLPPGVDALDRIIRQPASSAGLQFEQQGETSLADEILRDAAGHSEMLSLISFLLYRLCELRTEKGVLTFGSYEMQGGVTGALPRNAETAIEKLNPSPEVLENLISGLVASGDETEAGFVRRSALLSDLGRDEESNRLIEGLIQSRILSSKSLPDGSVSVIFAHDALLRVWPRAVAWLEGNREFLRMRSRIARASNAWVSGARDDSLLLASGLALEEGRHLVQSRSGELNTSLINYVETSIRHNQQREAILSRRRRLAMAALGGLLLFALIAAMMALAQERAARESRDKALASRKEAEDLIDYMQYDLRDTLAKVGKLSLMQSIDDRISHYQRENPAASSDLKSERDRAVTLGNQGDVLVSQGRLVQALESYREFNAIVRHLVAAEPGNLTWQGDLSLSLEKLGGVFAAQGDLAAAEAYYRDSLAIRESLVEADPTNTRWYLDLAATFFNVGDVLQGQGKYVEAQESYEAGLVIAKRLFKTDPNSESVMLTLALAHMRIGEVQMDQSYGEEALESYKRFLAIIEMLVAVDPSNAERLFDLSVGYRKIGDVQLELGDMDAAVANYQRGLDLSERLVAVDTTNTIWQRSLSEAHARLGNVQQGSGDLVEALASYRTSLDLITRLAGADPANAIWQRDLARNLFAVARVLAIQDNVQEAQIYGKRSLAIYESVMRLDPSNVSWKRDVEINRNFLAGLEK